MVQYSGNAGIAACSKPLDATCMSYIHAARKFVKYTSGLGLFEGALLPALENCGVC